MRLRWWGLTHPGKVRKNNEDAFLGVRFDGREVEYLGKLGEASLGSDDYAFAVSDGMGGAAAGEFASRITVEKITELLPPAFRRTVSGLAAGYSEVLDALFLEVHRALVYLGGSYEECSGMGATLSLCWFSPDWMHWAHVGDSRIYYAPANETGIRQLTRDDTHVAWLLEQGQISEFEARTHPMRNSLQRALGAGHQVVDPQLGAVGIERGDRFLLCSDGLSNEVFDHALEDAVRGSDPESENPSSRLLAAALQAGAPDNVTVLVVEVC